MHAIAFGTKRAFHGFLRITRRPLASAGLTAARFDVLFLLAGERASRFTAGMRQSAIWRALGVTPGVVSRMLRGLEERGMIARARPIYGDQRQRDVSLTERGRQCLITVRRWLLRGMQRIVLHAICYGAHDDPEVCFWNMAELEEYLRVMRRHFGDRATLYYRWGHPDD
jgi:DNA-binding MarR family transcriptional regulator